MLSTVHPKDCKNVTFDALSFFFPMQLDERVLSSYDVTGLVKNALSLCVRSVTVISSPRKSSNRPFWSTTRTIRSVMLRAMIGSLLSFTAFATLATPPIKDPSAPSIGRNDNAPPRFAVGSIRFFIAFFFIVFFFFGFMPMPILVLAFIVAQMAAAAALSLRAESLATTRPVDLCRRHLWLAASSAECPDRKTGNPGYVTRKEARLSLDSTDRLATPTFATVLYLRCGTVDVRSLPRLIVVLVAATIGSNLRISLHVFRKLVPDVFDVVAVHA
ncbi:hypothetical protein ALC57_16774 [Trachymyrmex cornetzi]|uniref:Uncharacterized protein n=1 Tax=Trachymyrmex cornetzi TaxID=471704 RepID=A0A151IUH8_9HYME|nr:hypothetical protein ALC57_16774 [Trachymyrmex cornetzi]